MQTYHKEQKNASEKYWQSGDFILPPFPEPEFPDSQLVEQDNPVDLKPASRAALRLPQDSSDYICLVCGQDNHLTVDAWHTLARNAAAHARWVEEERLRELRRTGRAPKLVPTRQAASTAPRPSIITATVRAEYEAQLAQLTRVKIADGMSQTQAKAEALDNLGCVEYFDWLNKTRNAQARRAA